MALRMHQTPAVNFVTTPVNPPIPAADLKTSVELSPFDNEFAITTQGRTDRLVISVKGLLDESSLNEFRRAVVQAITGPERLIIIDASGVPLIDSDGFGALINLQKRLTETGKTLALAGCQEPVRIALALTRLEVLFPTYLDVDSVP